MNIKIKLLISLLACLVIGICVKCFFKQKSIPIPISYPSRYNYRLEVNQPIISDKLEMSVLFFTSDSCAPCVKMKRLVWPDEKVKKSVEEYNNSPYILNSSNEKDIGDFDRYTIKYVPTTIIADREGEEIKRSVGYMDIKQILKFLD